ncbi:MAG TPA: acyl carrier protein [Burkholderiaceae bacterium]|jgi:acyl carrier protein
MSVTEASKNAIKDKIAAFLKIPPSRIDDEMPLKGIVPDSFMLVELFIELQEDYAIRLDQSDVEGIATVADLTTLVAERAAASATVAESVTE